MSMRRVTQFITFAIVALLLPGLALATPVAGACGRCGDGDGCHLQQPTQPAPETHSCCETESETAPEASFGSSNCECGREAPPAVSVDASPTVEIAAATSSVFDAISLLSPAGAGNSSSSRPAAPPPAPPAYLIDCAFLT